MGARRRRFGAAVAAALLVSASGSACGAETAGLYQAYWAGLPAGDIRLVLRDDPTGYRDEIAIRSEGLAWLFTKFRGTATAEGRLAADRPPSPSHYEAHYDLRKAHGKRQTMRFVSRASAMFADRGPDDTSQRPQLAEEFRKNVVDPLSALTAIRHELRRGNRGSFTVPVYDGARRFDVIARVLPSKSNNERVLHLRLTLSPIAGFKGETSEDGDPDDPPRKVEFSVDEARMVPLSITVPVFALPLVVQFQRLCAAPDPCIE